MNAHFSFLLLDVLCLLALVAVIFFFRLQQIIFSRTLLSSLALVAVGASFICVLLVNRGVVWFQQDFVLPWLCFGMPLEAYFYCFILPLLGVVVALCYDHYHPTGSGGEQASWRNALQLAAMLGIYGIVNFERVYSLIAFAGCGLALLLVFLLRNCNPNFNVNRFLRQYAFCLLPFFLVHGLLTYLPVLQTDESETVGFRLLSIPIEDVFLGMAVVLPIVWSYNFFQYPGNSTAQQVDQAKDHP